MNLSTALVNPLLHEASAHGSHGKGAAHSVSQDYLSLEAFGTLTGKLAKRRYQLSMQRALQRLNVPSTDDSWLILPRTPTSNVFRVYTDEDVTLAMAHTLGLQWIVLLNHLIPYLESHKQSSTLESLLHQIIDNGTATLQLSVCILPRLQASQGVSTLYEADFGISQLVHRKGATAAISSIQELMRNSEGHGRVRMLSKEKEKSISAKNEEEKDEVSALLDAQPRGREEEAEVTSLFSVHSLDQWGKLWGGKVKNLFRKNEATLMVSIPAATRPVNLA